MYKTKEMHQWKQNVTFLKKEKKRLVLPSIKCMRFAVSNGLTQTSIKCVLINLCNGPSSFTCSRYFTPASLHTSPLCCFFSQAPLLLLHSWLVEVLIATSVILQCKQQPSIEDHYHDEDILLLASLSVIQTWGTDADDCCWVTRDPTSALCLSCFSFMQT